MRKRAKHDPSGMKGFAPRGKLRKQIVGGTQIRDPKRKKRR